MCSCYPCYPLFDSEQACSTSKASIFHGAAEAGFLLLLQGLVEGEHLVYAPDREL